MIVTINPIFIKFGPISIYWYGITYFISLLIIYYILINDKNNILSNKQTLKMILFGIIGMLIGAKLGDIILYNNSLLYNFNLTKINKIFTRGFSFHGGLIGTIIAIYLFTLNEKLKNKYTELLDYICVYIPIGICLVRFGNFINGELFGKPTTLPWGVIFYNDPYKLSRHPTQIYESIFEGLILFIILKFYTRKKRPIMHTSGIFLILYGIFRFIIEFIKLPEKKTNCLILNWFTIGQILSLPMILMGFYIIIYKLYKK